MIYKPVINYPVAYRIMQMRSWSLTIVIYNMTSFFRYNVIEFVRNAAIDQRTFMDNAEQLVLRDKDPQFPESALFALSQLDQG